VRQWPAALLATSVYKLTTANQLCQILQQGFVLCLLLAGFHS